MLGMTCRTGSLTVLVLFVISTCMTLEITSRCQKSHLISGMHCLGNKAAHYFAQCFRLLQSRLIGCTQSIWASMLVFAGVWCFSFPKISLLAKLWRSGCQPCWQNLRTIVRKMEHVFLRDIISECFLLEGCVSERYSFWVLFEGFPLLNFSGVSFLVGVFDGQFRFWGWVSVLVCWFPPQEFWTSQKMYGGLQNITVGSLAAMCVYNCLRS